MPRPQRIEIVDGRYHVLLGAMNARACSATIRIGCDFRNCWRSMSEVEIDLMTAVMKRRDDVEM